MITQLYVMSDKMETSNSAGETSAASQPELLFLGLFSLKQLKLDSKLPHITIHSHLNPHTSPSLSTTQTIKLIQIKFNLASFPNPSLSRMGSL